MLIFMSMSMYTGVFHSPGNSELQILILIFIASYFKLSQILLYDIIFS